MAGSYSSRMRDLALRAIRAFGGFALAQRLTRRHLRILCYHGLSQGDEHVLLPYMFIRPETFESRLRILKRRGIVVLSLDDAVRKLSAGELDHTCAVVTFDDGWASNLTLALPILEKYDCPACIYVTTEHLDGRPEAFNVILLYLLLRSKQTLVTLSGVHPRLDGTYDLRIGPHAVVRTLAQRAEAAIPLSERQQLLEPIAAALGLELRDVLHNGRFRLLDRCELMQLAKHDAIALELHTHTHQLPSDSFQAMAREIEHNRCALRASTGREARHFCYPSGLYGDHHPHWLRQLGILSATTCDPGLNGKSDSVMLLKRYLDNDKTSDILFEAQVCGLHQIMQNIRWALRGRLSSA